jgi:hypothetical protein
VEGNPYPTGRIQLGAQHYRGTQDDTHEVSRCDASHTGCTIWTYEQQPLGIQSLSEPDLINEISHTKSIVVGNQLRSRTQVPADTDPLAIHATLHEVVLRDAIVRLDAALRVFADAWIDNSAPCLRTGCVAFAESSGDGVKGLKESVTTSLSSGQQVAGAVRIIALLALMPAPDTEAWVDFSTLDTRPFVVSDPSGVEASKVLQKTQRMIERKADEVAALAAAREQKAQQEASKPHWHGGPSR